MKLASLGTAFFLAAAFNVVSLAAQAAESVTPEPYRYGTHLDINKVVSLREAPSVLCQVVDARMDYLDSKGRLHSLEYRKHSDACSNEN
ncbi:DUF2790 domain-containing protein [Pseudomonas sp. JS3066]|uniref:DUF2790 domain-containing protein n=1 Tax=unclassified Pseudomonas TaxID=196821 RepID=UPI00129E4948|nr:MULTISPECIES: DUF2790 domain-containing protein [unclassified Pseudomonas]MRK21859.1 DUF2790 domain-containing protein [Pseudomonas sp. JG-B]WVK95688.1 DUF2790 domain-containing protein [Pseudomonas sp. JS3066]